MARESSAPVKTFSIGFRKADFNEAEYARLVAERFSTDHHELIVDPDIGEILNRLTTMMEEPFADSSMIPTYCVSQLARQHVTVALSGDGGDELFAGYDRYYVNLERRRFEAIPGWAGDVYRNHVYPHLPSDVKGRKFAWNVTLGSRDRYLDDISYLPALHRERSLFSLEFLASAGKGANPLQEFQRFYDRAPASDDLSRLLYVDTKTYLEGDILTKVDRMSMANSLEMRCPILDHKFVEWVVGLPLKYKYRDGTRKFMLKKLAERLGIPAQLLHRRKQGFALPLVHWMRNELKDGLLQLLQEPRTLQRGYFRPAKVKELLDEHSCGRRDHSGALWMMLVFEMWHRNFLEARGKHPLGGQTACLHEPIESQGVALAQPGGNSP
jgi:asparagine synthase (glutamine-hydrolysing)